jgi:hypothetical protein
MSYRRRPKTLRTKVLHNLRGSAALIASTVASVSTHPTHGSAWLAFRIRTRQNSNVIAVTCGNFASHCRSKGALRLEYQQAIFNPGKHELLS